MTSAELYELVKDDVLMWHPTVSYEQGDWWLEDSEYEPMTPTAAELMLESLYARATGCGVEEFGGDYMAYDLNDNRGRFYGGHPTRLAALVAAYRANKENGK